MQATREVKQRPRSFIEQSRRAQIVDAAISTIAEVGYAKASFARIAERAGLSSTGLISYHFANRAELIAEVVDRVFGLISALRGGADGGPAGPADRPADLPRGQRGLRGRSTGPRWRP